MMLGVALVLLCPIFYIGMYAGDAEIHLVYAENAAKGDFFEFNSGEKSSGVTSVGYMLLLAAIFKLSPDILVPVVIKLINLLSWYTFILLIYLVARVILENRTWAYLTALISGLLPGSVYNSTIGMENGMFGLLIMFSIYLSLRWELLPYPVRQQTGRQVVVGSILGVAATLRPEGLIIGTIILGYVATLIWYSSRSFKKLVPYLGPSSIAFLGVTVPTILLHLSMTGDIFPSSGLSRIISSQNDSFSVGPFWFNPKFALRLLYYIPLTAPWIVGNWLILTGRWTSQKYIGRLLLLIFWAFLILYSTVLGSEHLARYTVFAMPLMVMVSAIGSMWIWKELSRIDIDVIQWAKNSVYALAIIALLAIFTAETYLRTNLGSHSALWDAMNAPQKRSEFSDHLMILLNTNKPLPVSLAYQEVQVRYQLDDRFVVRSLDGRTDKLLLNYVNDGNYDHVGYIKDREIDFVIDLVNYNEDNSLWSLASLGEMEIGEKILRDGVLFQRLPSGIIAVSHKID